MHISSEYSHWVCILFGLVLVVSSLFSHLPRRVAGTAMVAAAPNTHPELLRRLIMIAIGAGAVAYGVSRLVA